MPGSSTITGRGGKAPSRPNCAAIPETLLEAELFSQFERAAGGTLFVDEIAELPLTLQAPFLRVLQAGRMEPGRSSETLQTDVRIIAAATPALEQVMAEGQFRHDLFYRLNISPIALPPGGSGGKTLSPWRCSASMTLGRHVARQWWGYPWTAS